MTMFSEPRFCLDPVVDVPVDIVELQMEIDRLPPKSREMIQPFLQIVLDSSQRRRRIVRLIREALDQLQLEMKYLKFDLEATRRERDQMRASLDSDQPEADG